MALIRLNNQSISSVTALPSGVGGKVVQYKYANALSSVTTSSTTLAEIDTNLRVSITPTSASNKILIRYWLGWVDSLATGRDMKMGIFRDTTNLSSDAGANTTQVYFWQGSQFQGTQDAWWIDSTYNTTSAISYRLYVASGGVGSVNFGSGGKYSFGEAIEIAS
jgi:hypothetical protein